MVVRVSRRGHGMRRIVVPAQRRERIMGIVWVPLVTAWIAMPFVAPAQDPVRHPWIGIHGIALSHPVFTALRATAAGIAFLCLLMSVRCWLHMGKDWRMGIDPHSRARLITSGPFAKVRHPIYALSIALMFCSVVVIPTPAMSVVAVLHITLMYLKARNEEESLLKTHGQSYSEYCRRTGRFMPRLRPSG